MCRRIHGDAPVTNPHLVAVEPPTDAQRRADREHGWGES
jgi:hypothetical protein